MEVEKFFKSLPPTATDGQTARWVYFDPGARPWLVSHAAWLYPDDANPDSERSRMMTQAIRNPKLFRMLDRRTRFQFVILGGDPSHYHALLEHLLETKDFQLVGLDHAAIVLQRGTPTAWSARSLETTLPPWKDDKSHAVSLARAANRLLAMRLNTEADKALRQAESLDSMNPEVQSARAFYHMVLGDWYAAEKEVDRALKLDPDFFQAVSTKAQVLFGTRRFSKAFDYSVKLIEKYPNDPGLLFYHAKIAHEAKAYESEIRTLNTLIAQAEAQNFPAAGYRVYLGQAHAAAGDAEPAIAAFSQALSDPDLPKEQREFAKTTLAQVKERSGK